MTILEYLQAYQPDLINPDLKRQRAKLSSVAAPEARIVAPAPTVVEPQPGLMAASGGAPRAQEPLSAPSKLEYLKPATQASDALQKFLQQPTPAEMRPTMRPLPTRDAGAEAHQAGDAALYAGLFGLGFGSRGGVSMAPGLAAAASAGSQQGADRRYQIEEQRVAAQNQMAQDQAQIAHQAKMDELRGLQIGAQSEEDRNAQARMAAATADTLAQRDEAQRRSLLQHDDALAAKTAQERAKGRNDFIDQMQQMDVASQHALLDSAERGGELSRLGLDQWFVRTPDGKWGVSLAPRGKEFAPMQDPKFVALRDRARRLGEMLKPTSNISKEFRAELSQQLAEVERALGVGTGVGLPPEAFGDMTPYQAAQVGMAKENFGQRVIEANQTQAMREADLNLRRQGIDLQMQRMDLDMKKYLGDQRGEWTKDGLPKINEINTQLGAIQVEVAKLRSGRPIVDKFGDVSSVIPPTQDEMLAADNLVKIMNDKMMIQDAIANRYGYKRDVNGGWRPPVVPKRTGPVMRVEGKLTPPKGLPPIPGLTPAPSIFQTQGKR